MKDRELKKLVVEELEFEPQVDATSIGVAVKDGVVSIYGHVNSFLQKMAAEDATRRVRGVRAIANEIDVNLPGDAIVHDDEIALRAARIFDWDPLLGKEDIRIRVQRGHIDLEGETSAMFVKRRAELLLTRLRGITGVSNHIRVVPPVHQNDVARQIGAALKRLAERDADNIGIEVENGNLTLRGQVDSLLKKQRIEEAVSHMPGVRHVTSELLVRG